MRRPLALLLTAAALSACHKRAPAVAEDPLQRLEGFRLTQSTLGKPGWDLRARLATLEDGDKKASLVAPQLAFYKEKKEVSTVTADAGTVRTDTYDLTLTTRVVVRSLEDQTTLSTEELRYSSQRRKFFTDREVLVRRPGGTLRGKGLEASPDLSDIRIYNQKTVVNEAPR